MNVRLFIFFFFFFGLCEAMAVCSLEKAEAKVNQVCHELENQGIKVKTKWPKSLLYENCGDNYVWIQDTSKELQMVIHPIKRGMDGTSLIDYVDENKFYLGREVYKAAKENKNGAWIEYVWNKPGESKATPKKSFVKVCKIKDDIEVVLGSGVWKNDLK